MKEYKIKRGRHSCSGFNFGLNTKNYIRFEAMFDESCLYTIPDNDLYDINKLYGYVSMWYHHYQSARVGWRCIDGENIQLLTYSYNGGNRFNSEHDVLGEVKPNEKFECFIGDLEHAYEYTLYKADGTSATYTDAKEPDWFPFKYLLYPYFGGQKVAPHDMKIYIKRLK